MKTKTTGRCTCGSITYECSEAPKLSMMCQCRQCQRITGSGHTAQFAVDAAKTLINGNVKSFDLTSDAGNTVKIAFSEICGNSVYKNNFFTTTIFMAPALVFFHAATLDDPSIYRPQMVVNSEFAQAWDQID